MVLFHADDYGLDPHESEKILYCRKHGCLNSVSVMPNSPLLDECLHMLDGQIRLGVHLNFMEGRCCSVKQEVSLLVDEEGMFCLSYGKMLLLSCIRYRSFRRQIKAECAAQIQRVVQLTGMDCRLRIDSHLHCHMIPAVFHGLKDACRQLHVDVEYVRWPVEPLLPYLRHRNVWRCIPPVNLVKNLLLHLFALVNYPVLVKAGWKNKTAVFFGVLFTGKMFFQPVACVLPEFEKLAEKKNKDLEVLFHPGGIDAGDVHSDIRFAEFYNSPCRAMESDTLIRLKKQNRRQKKGRRAGDMQ